MMQNMMAEIRLMTNNSPFRFGYNSNGVTYLSFYEDDVDIAIDFRTDTITLNLNTATLCKDVVHRWSLDFMEKMTSIMIILQENIEILRIAFDN